MFSKWHEQQSRTKRSEAEDPEGGKTDEREKRMIVDARGLWHGRRESAKRRGEEGTVGWWHIMQPHRARFEWLRHGRCEGGTSGETVRPEIDYGFRGERKNGTLR